MEANEAPAPTAIGSALRGGRPRRIKRTDFSSVAPAITGSATCRDSLLASSRVNRRARLAYLVSHPIQYQAPLLRRIAREPDIDLTVLFGSDFSLHTYNDSGFGVPVTWDRKRARAPDQTADPPPSSRRAHSRLMMAW